jgi:hypothetical protein
MDIIEPLREREIVDYDFLFISGSKLAIVVDVAAGDTATELPDRYVMSLSSKPSASDPDDLSDPETMEVFKVGLAAVVTCKRKQRMPTEEELFDMQKTYHSIAKGVQ